MWVPGGVCHISNCRAGETKMRRAREVLVTGPANQWAPASVRGSVFLKGSLRSWKAAEEETSTAPYSAHLYTPVCTRAHTLSHTKVATLFWVCSPLREPAELHSELPIYLSESSNSLRGGQLRAKSGAIDPWQYGFDNNFLRNVQTELKQSQAPGYWLNLWIPTRSEETIPPLLASPTPLVVSKMQGWEE